MYITTCTRPDIAHAVGEVAKYCERYNKSHWTAAKRIIKYLKTTQDMSIVCSKCCRATEVKVLLLKWSKQKVSCIRAAPCAWSYWL